MKVLIISTNIFPIPLKGYGGLEQLTYELAEGLHSRGHSVAIVAPHESCMSDGIELISGPVNEPEEQTWLRYKQRLDAGEWDVVVDASWQRWATMSNVNVSPQLAIINWHHTDPSVYQSPAPVQYNMWVGLSRSHAANLSNHLKMQVKWVYNGINIYYYKNDTASVPLRLNYLWLARYTPEKGAAEIINLAQKLRIRVDMYGDTNIISDRRYLDICMRNADGYFARFNGGISREATVQAYSTHKALLQWYGWEEPFGLTLCEAMACGCVPVVCKRGAAPELIRDGETGFLVDSMDDMERVIKSGNIEQLKPEVMRKHVEDNFSIMKFVDNWEKLLHGVVAGDRW